jgi:hypothetical protein
MLNSSKTIYWQYLYLLESYVSLRLEDWKRFFETSTTQPTTEIWSNRIFQTIAKIEIDFLQCLWPATPNTCCRTAISSRTWRVRFSESWEIYTIYLCPHQIQDFNPALNSNKSYYAGHRDERKLCELLNILQPQNKVPQNERDIQLQNSWVICENRVIYMRLFRRHEKDSR